MSTNDQLVESWKEEFRAAYSRDTRNAARQTFDDYWYWVKVFFVAGGAGQPGWLDQVELALRGVRDEAARERLRERLRALGKTIGAEWSKESRYRRIHSIAFQGSPNLQDWGRRLQRAAASDTGDGAAIERALGGIEREAAAALSKAV
jgi:hypothetical protein